MGRVVVLVLRRRRRRGRMSGMIIGSLLSIYTFALFLFIEPCFCSDDAVCAGLRYHAMNCTCARYVSSGLVQCDI
jgi:Na+/proline symporter